MFTPCRIRFLIERIYQISAIISLIAVLTLSEIVSAGGVGISTRYSRWMHSTSIGFIAEIITIETESSMCILKCETDPLCFGVEYHIDTNECLVSKSRIIQSFLFAKNVITMIPETSDKSITSGDAELIACLWIAGNGPQTCTISPLTKVYLQYFPNNNYYAGTDKLADQGNMQLFYKTHANVREWCFQKKEGMPKVYFIRLCDMPDLTLEPRGINGPLKVTFWTGPSDKFLWRYNSTTKAFSPFLYTNKCMNNFGSAINKGNTIGEWSMGNGENEKFNAVNSKGETVILPD